MSFLNKIRNLLPSLRKEGKSDKKSEAENRKIIIFVVLLMFSIVALVVIFAYESILAGYGKKYSAIVNNQQVISQQIATFSLEAANGKSASFIQLARYKQRFERTLNQFNNGDTDLELPPLPAALKADLADVEKFWAEYDQNIRTILDSRESIETVTKYVVLINESIPELLALSDQIVSLMIEAKAGRKEIAIAAKQLALIQSVKNNLNQIVSGGDSVMSAADAFANETALIERLLIAMLEGSTALNIKQFTGDEVVNHLLQVADLFSIVKKNVNQILENSPQLFEVTDAAADLQLLSPKLLSATVGLEKSISLYDDRLNFLKYAGYLFGAIALGLLLALGRLFYKGAQDRLEESKAQNSKNQEAILRLLDEMANLADGDLSSYTTVTEDITGAIADSVNYSIDALRDLVVTINQTAVQVTGAVDKTQKITLALSDESKIQSEQIQTVSSSVSDISQSISDVAENASESADIARKSVTIAHEGSVTVKRTITGMENIREQIQETSKRIKRLGESSQEIGDIVGLITEISDQTNILALNAAIQASMAGEAGRGFAVVADEVQRLAERTGGATKQISALVKTIQADTNEAIASMEQSTTNVVDGANLAEQAGEALENIENVSLNLASKILAISDQSKTHAQNSTVISETMGRIRDITNKTLEGSNETYAAIDELARMVKDLQKSVAGFKLPGVGLEDTQTFNDNN